MTVRPSPPEAPDVWHDIAEAPDGRLTVALGRSPDPAIAARVAAALRAGADPLTALQPVTAAEAVCAVIDRPAARLTYSILGDIPIVVTSPDAPPEVLDPADRRLASMRLSPGATVLFCIPGLPEPAAEFLEQIATLHPDQAMDRIVDVIPGALTVVYRQTPAPMELTVPADPTSLAAVRAHLRHWLALTGLDSEKAADTLLAVGEAASNATEHSVLGVAHDVKLTVRAAVDGDRLRFTVSDNGRWKPPPESPGHRGHGIRLINALVDDAELSTDERGTTVEMIKGWCQ